MPASMLPFLRANRRSGTVRFRGAAGPAADPVASEHRACPVRRSPRAFRLRDVAGLPRGVLGPSNVERGAGGQAQAADGSVRGAGSSGGSLCGLDGAAGDWDGPGAREFPHIIMHVRRCPPGVAGSAERQASASRGRPPGRRRDVLPVTIQSLCHDPIPAGLPTDCTSTTASPGTCRWPSCPT